MYHCKSLIKDVKTFLCICGFTFLDFCILFWWFRVKGRDVQGKVRTPPKPRRFEWEGIKAVICWLMSLQWVQTQTSLVPPHLHLYGAAHNSSAPVGRTELLLSDPADVSAATPCHLPPSMGGGRHWQGREEPWKVGAKGASLFGSGRFVELLNIIWCPASWTFMSLFAFSETLANRPQRRQIINSSHLLRHATKTHSLLPLQHF